MTNTKWVSYMEQNFEVPLWAKFIAADTNHQVFVFSINPKLQEHGYWSIGYNTGRSECVGYLDSSMQYPCGMI